jgi:catechol 2,3-dioxygenase-like lactoylglutathione lyase family enzyme
MRLRGAGPEQGASMIKDIDHVQIAIPPGAEDRARDFYGRILRLVEVDKPENLRKRGGVWFSLGLRQFHLGVDKDFVPTKKAHPAFLVEDVEQVKRALEANGYTAIDDEPLQGFDRIYALDPFGNRLEFLKPAE